MILIYVYIFIIWTLFWSFSSVIISRLKNNKSWIISWRSECTNCKHKLWTKDLIPIFSFLLSKWKCNYCKEKISIIYPILEIVSWLLFMLVWYFLIDINLILWWNIFEIIKAIFLFTLTFLSIAYVFYDILYLEIPDKILFILIVITFVWISFQSLIPWFNILNILPSYNNLISLNQTIFLIWFSFLVLILFYTIMLKWLKEIYDIIILTIIWWWFIFIKYYLNIDFQTTAIWSAIFASFLVFCFLFLQIVVSSWRWMWWWDLRIWILLWLLLWSKFFIIWMFISYLSWSILWIWYIIYYKIHQYLVQRKSLIYKFKKFIWINNNEIKLNTQIPFWPFLALWIFAVLFYSSYLWELFKNYL